MNDSALRPAAPAFGTTRASGIKYRSDTHRVMPAGRLKACAAVFGLSSCLFLAGSMMAAPQFKEIGPAPISATVARQQMRTLLEKVDAGNRQQTIQTLSGLTPWYRDLLDEELIAAWRSDDRAKLTQVIGPLADPRVAAEIVEFSWRQQRQATFTPEYAPMLGDLMARYPDSATMFLDDLFRSTAMGQTPELSPPEAEAVCRILLDMPDIRTWKKSALQILPHYRRSVQVLLDNDLHGEDREKMFRATRWLAELGPANSASVSPGSAARPVAVPPAQGTTGSNGAFRAGGGVSRPSLIYKVEPEYSEVARRLHAEGVVLLYVVVQRDGTAQNIRVLKSVGYGLDQKAIDAVQRWRFKPGMKEGNPVAVEAQIDVNFSLFKDKADTWYSGPLVFPVEAGFTPPVVETGTMPGAVPEIADESAVLEFTVDSNGAVKNTRAIHGSEAASEQLTPYLATWKFRPAVSGNRPVEATGRVRFVKGQGDEAAKLPLAPPPPTPAATDLPDGRSESCVTPPPGLVGWWPGDSNENDIVGGNNPSAVNAVNLVTGKVRNGFTLGQRGYIEIPKSSSLENQRFTWLAWVKPDGSGPNASSVIINQHIDGTHASVNLAWRPSDQRFTFHSGASATELVVSADSFPAGAFYLVAATYDGAAFHLYVNGILEGSLAKSKSVAYSSYNWAIGAGALRLFSYGPADTWNGVIDELQAYDRALSATEISSIFRAGSAGVCKDAATGGALSTAANAPENQHLQNAPLDPPGKPVVAPVDGTLRKLGEKDLYLQTNSKTVLRFRLLARTEFRDKQGAAIRDSLLHPGDQLSLMVNPDDPETVVRVELVRAGTAAERKSAETSVAKSSMRAPETKDLGKAQTIATQGTATAEPKTAALAEPEVPRVPAESREPLLNTDAALLAAARTDGNSSMASSSNLQWEQSTTRYFRSGSRAAWQKQDVVTATVAPVQGKEEYRDVKVNGSPTRVSPEQSGSWATGAFTTLATVLSQATNASFNRRGEQSISGRLAVVFDFTVAQGNSNWTLNAPDGRRYKPAYEGTLWMDKDTQRTVRVEHRTTAMPADFPFRSAESAVNYELVKVNQQAYLLPALSENLVCTGGGDCSRSLTRFSNYRQAEPAPVDPIRPASPPARIQREPMVNKQDGQHYVWVPPGAFTMGCSAGDTECNDNEKPPRAEQIANGFWLGETEVTQAAYLHITKSNPSYHKGDQLPVDSVTWNDANRYCGVIGGHLPTEAQWEYAARGHAGITPARYGNLDAVAWYSGNSGGKNHPVAQKQPNAFGLYDMLGNVWEWVEDSDAGNSILRGGSSEVYRGDVRASLRSVVAPSESTPTTGFRCAGEWPVPEQTPPGGGARMATPATGSGGAPVNGVYRTGNGVSAPALLRKVEPEYSEEARQKKYQGSVLLYIQIDPSGKAINVRVLHSLGLGLDEKAMEAVKKWKFRPGYKDGKAVTVESQVEVNFRLL